MKIGIWGLAMIAIAALAVLVSFLSQPFSDAKIEAGMPVTVQSQESEFQIKGEPIKITLNSVLDSPEGVWQGEQVWLEYTVQNISSVTLRVMLTPTLGDPGTIPATLVLIRPTTETGYMCWQGGGQEPAEFFLIADSSVVVAIVMQVDPTVSADVPSWRVSLIGDVSLVAERPATNKLPFPCPLSESEKNDDSSTPQGLTMFHRETFFFWIKYKKREGSAQLLRGCALPPSRGPGSG